MLDLYDYHDYDSPSWARACGGFGWSDRRSLPYGFRYIFDESAYPCEIARHEALAKWQRACKRAKLAWRAAKSFKLPAVEDKLPTGSITPMPQELWSLVFRQLATTLELDGLRGPGVVAADIVRAGMACRDMYHASRAGLQALAEAAPVDERGYLFSSMQAGADAPDWALWDRLLCRPTDATIPDLTSALRQLGVQVPPTKAMMAQRLLKHFNLTTRCPVPSRLWVALQQERRLTAYDGFCPSLRTALQDLCSVGHEAARLALHARSLAAARRYLIWACGSTAGLLAAHTPALEVLRRRREEAEERKAQMKELRNQEWAARRRRIRQEKREPELARRPVAVVEELEARRAALLDPAGTAPKCVCKSILLKDCPLLLCRPCCLAYNTGPCKKHKRS